MLFMDDVVLVDERRTGLNQKLELWRVLTPKFGKLTLERKRSADDVKNKIIGDICLLSLVFEARSVSIADQEILFNVFGWKEIEWINHSPTATR